MVSDKVLKEMRSDFSQFSQIVTSHSVSIKHLETQLGTMSTHLNQHPKGGLPSDTVANPKGNNQECMAITICSGKVVEGVAPIPGFELEVKVRILYLRVLRIQK